MIAIIDYDAGNIKSVCKALDYLKCEYVLTRDEDELRKADKLILPGVGAFGDAMDKLNSYGLSACIRKLVLEEKKPILGICLGLQLLFEESDEAPGIKGLSILEGSVKKFVPVNDMKIPHMGWNSLSFPKNSSLFKDVADNSYVYFVHSYYLDAKDKSIVAANCEYGQIFDAAVETDNIYACQFHPEKSSDVGLKIISNYLEV